MKFKYIYLTLIASLSLFSACEKINSANEAEEIGYISVNLTANSTIEEIKSTEGLKAVFENFTEGYKVEYTLKNGVNKIDNLIPGTYSINITGIAKLNKKDFYLIGSKINHLIFKDGENIEIDVNGATVGPLAFSEVYFAGSKTLTSANYFRDQFYEITNNSDETVYLDGLYFANLTPTTATTTLPIWPAEDGDKYAYAERIWRIPGTGKQYPLEPGESFSIAQFAANHKLSLYNPNGPIDCSTSEFEFNMDNANFPDQPATDMKHIFNNGLASKGTVPQYLTSVFGGAYVIFSVPEGEEYDPVGNANLKTRNLGTTSATLFAKIPVEYIIDGVEAGHNENMISAKRVPSLLDAGMTYVGETYNSKSVRRKKIGTRSNGTPILQDTNNSTDDFERLVTPTFRFYNQGIPAWSSAN